ncbi:Cullin repeat-like-containing domain protein [Cantharellus anzutake]|uniref:Cullin repeat-like-containing domain protein n=1 Tax=Cantharellus anzutake TaxID=1750568 RepID=UPI001907BB41|nr:Cullin repeat-like-containing domain protein [Cantharellus anzutake]KAF8334621.1 Cullin repeat-like-containing domain protein [Cantharellus anzutake]
MATSQEVLHQMGRIGARWKAGDEEVADGRIALLRLGGDVTRAFKTTSEELAARRRKEREGEQERRRSLWTAGERASMYNVLEADHKAGLSSLPVLSRCERGSADRAEVETQAVAIALWRWGEAVEIVERGQKDLAALPSLAPKLTSLIAELTSALLHSLSDPSLSKSAVVGVTSLLLRLNEGIAARNVFLSARGSLTKKRTRMIAFEGEVSTYIAELAFVVFTSIKHTANWYLASFEENEMASTLIQWAREQIECFATMFKRQVNDPHIGQQDVDASILAMLDQNKKVFSSLQILHDNGKDFAHLLMTLIEPLALSSLTTVPLPSTFTPSNASIPPLGSPQPPTLNISTSPLKLSNTSARAPHYFRPALRSPKSQRAGA